MAVWQDITIAPGDAPTVDRCETPDEGSTYNIAWPQTGLAVILSPAELQELVARALVASADAPTIDLG